MFKVLLTEKLQMNIKDEYEY